MKYLKLYPYLFLLITTGILILTGCGRDDYSPDLLTGIAQNGDFNVNEKVALPNEEALESSTSLDDSKSQPVEGKWERTIFQWNFGIEKSPYLKNGIFDIRLNLIPPKRFRLNFSFRHAGSRGCFANVYYNKIKLTSHSAQGEKLIAEYPLSFKSDSNHLKLLFYNDLLVVYFNEKEIGRTREVPVVGYGYIDSISIAAGGNLGSLVKFSYLSHDRNSAKEPFVTVFNRPINIQSASANTGKYFRSVRIGNTVMPSILAPAPSKIVLPVKIKEGDEIRFSISNVPVYDAQKRKIIFKLLYRIDDEEDVLFNESIVPIEAFDERWISCKVGLEKYYGTEGDLIFTTEIEDDAKKKEPEPVPQVIPLWGAPRIVSKAPDINAAGVILITIENFNSDAVLSERSLQPSARSIANFSKDSVVFKSVYPSSLWIPASLYGIETGRYAYKTGYFQPSGPPETLKSMPMTMAEFFRRRGYDTAAFFQGKYSLPFFGLYDGFNQYTSTLIQTGGEDNIESTSDLINYVAIWLERRKGKKIFLHVHFSVLSDVRNILAQDYINPRTVSKEYRDLYQKLLSEIDVNIGKLIGSLWKLGYLSTSIIVVSGVNGMETFNVVTSSISEERMKEENLEIPVIVHLPSKFPITGRRRGILSSIDLFPTIIGLMDFEGINFSDSRSVADIIKGADDNVLKDRVAAISISDPFPEYPVYIFRKGSIKLFYSAPDKSSITRRYLDLSIEADKEIPITEPNRIDSAVLEKALDSILKIDFSLFNPDKNRWTQRYLQILESSR